MRHPDGTSREYRYEAGESGWAHRLTGLTDRTGERVATWGYDGYGGAILSEGADGTERVSLVHPDPQTVERGEAVETRVTNAFGAESTYRWAKGAEAGAGGAPRLLGGTGPGCATCPATGIAYGYDAAGRLTSARRVGAGGSNGAGGHG